MSSYGRVYYYLGSANGLGAASPPLEGNNDGGSGLFGGTVASAGDINGDGYADVVIGASVATDKAGTLSAGHVYICLGRSTGLGAPGQPLEASDGVSNGYFSSGLAGAGDVNGDGYADVIIGAPGNGTAVGGAVYLYSGGAAGLGATPQEFKGADHSGQMGYSVGGGDVDGNGYSDIIMGAPYASNPTVPSDTGRVFLYMSSSAGLGSTPVDIESQDNDGQLGYSVQ
jgi:hypothetical protein